MLKKNHGFTLIELIIIISILGIIAVMAIPNIVNIQQKNLKKQYVQDAKDFIIAAQNQEVTNPEIAKNIVYKCPNHDAGDYLGTGGISFMAIDHPEIDKSPEGFDYDGVIAKKNGKYYVCLTEKDKAGKSGKRTIIATSTELYQDNAVRFVKDKATASSDCNITNISGTEFLNKICPSSD